MATHKNPRLASRNFQKHLKKLERWISPWRVEVKNVKSTHTYYIPIKTRTMSSDVCESIIFLSDKNDIKYLGIHIDNNLNYENRIWKQLQTDILDMKQVYESTTQAQVFTINLSLTRSYYYRYGETELNFEVINCFKTAKISI